MSEGFDPVGAQVDARFAPGQQVGHQRASPRSEAEADMPVAEGENGIPMTRRRTDHRDRVRHGGPIAHPEALLAPVQVGKPAAGIAVEHRGAPPVRRSLQPSPPDRDGYPQAWSQWRAAEAATRGADERERGE